MIAEAATIDAAQVGVGAAAVIAVAVAGWAATFTSLRADVRALAKDLRRANLAIADAMADAAEHRERDKDVHHQFDIRVHTIERDLEIATPRPITPEPHRSNIERRRTPRTTSADTPRPDEST